VSWESQCPELKNIFENSKDETTFDILKAPPEGVPSAAFNPLEAAVVDAKIATRLYDKTMLVPDSNPLPTREEVIRLLAVFEHELVTWLETSKEADAVHMLWNTIVNPIHLSSNREIDVMVKTLECTLRQLSEKQRSPSLITLARSPQFTPTHLIKHIECSVYAMLSRVYASRTVYYDSMFDADSSQCELGYEFQSIGVLGEEQESHLLSTPVELVIANVSPEPLVAHWRADDGELTNDFPVPAFSYDNANCMSFNDHEWVVTTTDGVIVDEKLVRAQDGHTQVWTITTGQVDAALRQKGMMRHRAL